jgi:hypothetical protein
MYADIPFPSGCRDPREEDCTGLDLDFFGLHNPEAMLQFLFTCDELLSDGSDDYITDEEGYDATRECFHIEHEEHDEGDQLGMPRENNAPPPHAGNQGSNVRLRPPRGVRWPTSSNSASCTPSSRRNNSGCNSFGKFSRGKKQARLLMREYAPRHTMPIIASWRMPRLKPLWPFTGPIRTAPQHNLAPHHARAIHHQGTLNPW